MEPFNPKAPEKGARVWLSQSELEQFIDCAPHERAKISLSLCSCGLRASEVVNLTNEMRFKDDRGWMVGITGKGNKYREVPIPKELSLVDLTCKVNQRTLGKWAKATAENYYWRHLAQSNSHKDKDIFYISPHDLRRTWGTLLLQAGVEPTIVMAWGGWESWEVFRQHYLDVANPEWQAKEREKVAWL